MNQAYVDSSDSDDDDFPGLDKLKERGGNRADFPDDKICGKGNNPQCDDEGCIRRNSNQKCFR